MPHLSIEYSNNLDNRVDIQTLCSTLARTIVETGLFELAAVRVRAIRTEAYAVADESPENAFVDLKFRIGVGRSVEDRKRVGEALAAAARSFLGDLFDAPHFALSLEIREIDPEFSWKFNAIRPRLRGR